MLDIGQISYFLAKNIIIFEILATFILLTFVVYGRFLARKNKIVPDGIAYTVLGMVSILVLPSILSWFSLHDDSTHTIVDIKLTAAYQEHFCKPTRPCEVFYFFEGDHEGVNVTSLVDKDYYYRYSIGDEVSVSVTNYEYQRIMHEIQAREN